MLNRLVASLYIAFIFLTSAVFFLVAVVIFALTCPVDRRLVLLHRFTCLWASLYIWVFPPWSVRVMGREHIEPGTTYVMVSNHQSMVDILVVFLLFTHFKWVSKAELFNLPFIGWNMYLNRYVRLHRGRSDSIKKMYRACERHLNEGSSVFLFPEGTRSETGVMRPFKDGAFVLATRLGVPILPIAIRGSRDALPKNSLNFHGRTDVEIEVLAPIPPTEFGDRTAAELARDVRALIGAHLADPAAATGDGSATA